MMDDQAGQMRTVNNRKRDTSKDKDLPVIRLRKEPQVPDHYRKGLPNLDLKYLKKTTATGFFSTYNKDQLKEFHVDAPVDKVYQEFRKMCNNDIEAFVKSTPFNRK